MEWLIAIGKEYGLFVMLVAYVLYTNQGRETRYINVIDKLADSVVSLENRMGNVEKGVDEIRGKV